MTHTYIHLPLTPIGSPVTHVILGRKNTEYLANCRPISNLNTVGKILERVALSSFFPHISKSPSFPPLQSAHRKFHPTETALLTNDIMEIIDSGKITILTASDMSAAFETLDHITLLHRLQHTFGLSGILVMLSLGFVRIKPTAYPL